MSETYSVDIENYSHLLFGLLAIQRGFISNLQLLEAVEVQKEEPEKKIGIILNELGHLQMKDVFAILKEQGKFREKKPQNWPYIPDTVLKGLVYFSEKPVLQNVSAKEIMSAHKLFIKYQEENRYKTLAKILIEDMGLTTESELKSIQNNIFFNARACSQCLRLFSLYNYDSNVKIACPVCTGKNLEITIDEWKKKKSHEEIVQLGLKNVLDENLSEEPEAEKYNPRATMALASFYDKLEKDAPQVKSLGEAPLMTSKKQPPNLNLNTTKAMPAIKARNATKAMQQMPVVKKNNKEELQELYKNLEEKEQERQIKKDQKIAASNKKIKLREGVDTVFAAKQRQGHSKTLKTFVVCLAVMFVLVAFFVFYGRKNEDIATYSLIVHEIPENAPVTIKTDTPQKKVEHDIAQSEVKKNIRVLKQSGTPNQDSINNILRNMYLLKEKYSSSGDFWNLIGRLYLYKIFIDREDNILIEKRIKILKIAATEALEKASTNYRQESTSPTFQMELSPWMPENFLKITSTNIIKYKSTYEAIEDLKKLINNIQLICDLTHKY